LTLSEKICRTALQYSVMKKIFDGLFTIGVKNAYLQEKHRSLQSQYCIARDDLIEWKTLSIWQSYILGTNWVE
jgi:hypothetical protein